jgi:N-glycosylase/DNA lyase
MRTENLQLVNFHSGRKREILKRLEEFRHLLDESEERIFAELSFCICTPQSNAVICWRAILKLMDNSLLYHGSKEEINFFLRGIRFHNNKAKYITEARNFFTNEGHFDIKCRMNNIGNTLRLRDWLVENVKGIGMKEASHFLRNIGLGEDLAILDRHIMRNLKELGVIEGVPKGLSKRTYLQIENSMVAFSRSIGIPMGELDLLLGSKETGLIFK